jgi:hypothetical protein
MRTFGPPSRLASNFRPPTHSISVGGCAVVGEVAVVMVRVPGVCLTHDRLLRPTRSGGFLRSFPLHSTRYARETIAETRSLGVALATAIMSQTDS